MATNNGEMRQVLDASRKELLQRGEKLESLQETSARIENGSRDLAKDAAALEKKYKAQYDALGGNLVDAAKEMGGDLIRALSPRSRRAAEPPVTDAASSPQADTKKEKKEKKPKKEKQQEAASSDQSKQKKLKKEKKEKKTKQREAVVSPSDSGSSETEMSPSRKDKKEKRKHKKKDKKDKKTTTAVLSGSESASEASDTEKKPKPLFGTLKAKGQQVLNAISPRGKTNDGVSKEAASDDDAVIGSSKPKLQRTDTNFAAIRSDDEITTNKRPSVKATNSEAKKLEAAAADAFSKGRNGSGKNFMGSSPRTGIPRSVSFDASANQPASSPRAKGSTTGARIVGRQAPEGQLSPSAVSLPPAAPSVADFRSAYDLTRPPLPPSGYNDTPPLSSVPSASRVGAAVGSSATAAASTTPRQTGSGKQLAERMLKQNEEAVAARRATAQQAIIAQPPLPSSGGGNGATATAQPPKIKQVELKVIPPKRNYWNLIAGFVIGVLALGAFAAGFALTYTGLLTPLGIAMTYGGIWLASSAAGLAGFALAIAAGLIIKEVAHLAYDHFFVDEEDKIVISAPITNLAMTKLQGQDVTKKATNGSDETFCYGLFNWLSRGKIKVPASVPEDQQRLIDGREQTQTQSLC